ncbi:hypothetical protein AXG93_948s1420 [Marchantia polymorpha subsp. ruderalis]|uniref:Uncharacterized protein n=1 Tax=Marchantia polymorpha subsp. ruderalis TaxID=1480154 RepID=A0A176VHZ3_MARPO|nr:hypothetical protein AXG93_948s1420 [Marchantia polymorpha subsp. ruderalis]
MEARWRAADPSSVLAVSITARLTTSRRQFMSFHRDPFVRSKILREWCTEAHHLEVHREGLCVVRLAVRFDRSFTSLMMFLNPQRHPNQIWVNSIAVRGPLKWARKSYQIPESEVHFLRLWSVRLTFDMWVVTDLNWLLRKEAQRSSAFRLLQAFPNATMESDCDEKLSSSEPAKRTSAFMGRSFPEKLLLTVLRKLRSKA